MQIDLTSSQLESALADYLAGAACSAIFKKVANACELAILNANNETHRNPVRNADNEKILRALQGLCERTRAAVSLAEDAALDLSGKGDTPRSRRVFSDSLAALMDGLLKG